jgi:hypothetical protein
MVNINDINSDTFYKILECERMFSCSRATILKIIKQFNIPTYFIGARNFKHIKGSDLINYLKNIQNI